MNRLHVWTLAFRPKTLIASISPVFIGTTLAVDEHFFNPLLFCLTLMTALGIQITTNLANDFFDFLKGADTHERKGPLRVTQARLVSLNQMKKALVYASLFTTLSACYLLFQGGPIIGSLFALSLLFAFLYTGGPFPLAYLGLGELFVLLFFGVAATSGTYFLQTGHFSVSSLLIGLAPGALSTAILVINNLRDHAEDRLANKKTLIVRFGISFGKIEYITCLLLPFLIPLFFCNSHPYSLLCFPLLIPTCKLIFSSKEDFNILFVKTGQLLWLFTLFFSIGWLL